MAVKYVTLPGDKTVHLYAESEFTKCGIPVPINAGAEWTETYDGKVCADCTKVADKADTADGGKVASKKDGGKVA